MTSNKNTQVTVEPDDKKENKCVACTHKIGDISLSCPSGHYLCEDDAKDFASRALVMDELWPPDKSTPPCNVPKCGAAFTVDAFLLLLDLENQGKFLQMHLARCRESLLLPGEIIVSCPRCDYFEIREMNQNQIFLVYCQNLFLEVKDKTGKIEKIKKCGLVTCGICKKTVTSPPKPGQHSEEWNDQWQDKDLAAHWRCFELSSIKNEIDTALDLANARRCPACKTRGRKDSMCNHMTCGSCRSEWCYVCGVQLHGDYTEHFRDFPRTACPLLLTALTEYDESWPDSDEEALSKLHNWLALGALKSLWKRNKQEFEAAWGHFNLEASGFSIKEIKKPPSPLYQLPRGGSECVSM